MTMTWDAILEQWPWFSAAAGVLVVVVGLLILLVALSAAVESAQ
jgi:hypothetical protein